MKLHILTLSIFILIMTSAVAQVRAQAYVYPPPPLQRTRTNWYTARPSKRTTAPKYVAPTIPLTPAQTAAKANLDRMAGALNSAEGVQFTATLTYPVTVAGKPSTKEATVTSTVERYVRFQIQTSTGTDPAGEISADGSLFTLYDAPKNSYVQISTTRDLWSVKQALQLGGKELFPKDTDSGRALRYAIDFPFLFLDKVYDEQQVPSGAVLNYTSAASTSPEGKPVTLVTQSLSSTAKGTVSGTWMIDSVTNLPVEFTQIETRPGQTPRIDLSETFSTFKLLHRSQPAVNYSFTPPAGASPVSGTTQ